MKDPPFSFLSNRQVVYKLGFQKVLVSAKHNYCASCCLSQLGGETCLVVHNMMPVLGGRDKKKMLWLIQVKLLENSGLDYLNWILAK